MTLNFFEALLKLFSIPNRNDRINEYMKDCTTIAEVESRLRQMEREPWFQELI